jgi:Methyltransferase domain
MFLRAVSRETLDVLAASDPRALRSRRDLRRINRIMGTCGIIIRGMQATIGRCSRDPPLRVLELGAGDGSVMLRVAQELSKSWPAVHLTLLDRQALVDANTNAAFARLGWRVQTLIMDVLDWVAAPTPLHLSPRWDVIVTNLFLHHFDDIQLPEVLPVIAARCNLFVACEPRRAPLSLIASHLIGAVGASRVTRQDAVLSVHAGFRAAELSIVWPHDFGQWQLQEHSAGLFSHFFSAARRGITVAETA